jgi:hypothetical protein
MYESIVPGLLDHNSLAGQLSNLSKLPTIESGKSYNWALALNAGQATILKALYAESSLAQASNNQKKIDSLETAMTALLRVAQIPMKSNALLLSGKILPMPFSNGQKPTVGMKDISVIFLQTT